MKKLVLILACIAMSMSGIFAQNTCKMNVATFNLRLDTPSDSLNSWSHRKEMVKSLIRFHDFDIFGTQEGFKHQLDGILELGNYAYTGAGRDDGKDAGEHSAVFYKVNRFELLDSGNFWYSETPAVPSKGWDANCCNRICSWGKFREKKSGREFYFFNSHFDHQGKVARHNSSLLLLAKIKEIAGNLPVFCTGDFNATPDDDPIQVIYKDGKLRDSYQITKEPPYGTLGTFNNFDLHSPCSERIDYIWVTDGIVVRKYGVLNEQQYGRFPSDHFPVMVKVSF
ncbi:MAG TPA: endonuclease/exonuclease/phosphatase family protein [Dysgonamonadaceae bacterium]|nr:endonuclease/exonuclease/phosphatase family protein [Dysgonamonadaceae bacterium]HPD43130.1 endonuclease/exonuclease/phosphatase family protein [Dysgonamonadaceae bacterium]HRS40664.1 endonuclease/exonuclease/phosphatase family protein [Dysgonamonadaceae bacterium]HRU13724.1 endonuclease/exonuclease/phosphatase family protein [Dysgonamonadaceae bacterium]